MARKLGSSYHFIYFSAVFCSLNSMSILVDGARKQSFRCVFFSLDLISFGYDIFCLIVRCGVGLFACNDTSSKLSKCHKNCTICHETITSKLRNRRFLTLASWVDPIHSAATISLESVCRERDRLTPLQHFYIQSIGCTSSWVARVACHKYMPHFVFDRLTIRSGAAPHSIWTFCSTCDSMSTMFDGEKKRS